MYMKNLLVKKLFLNRISLKLISLFLGYSFWYIATINQVITIPLVIPLYFTSQKQYAIEAPEKITVTIQAKRSDIYSIDQQNLAAHVTIDNLLPGKHGIIITNNHLFLPDTISIVNYTPANLYINIKETKTT